MIYGLLFFSIMALVLRRAFICPNHNSISQRRSIIGCGCQAASRRRYEFFALVVMRDACRQFIRRRGGIGAPGRISGGDADFNDLMAQIREKEAEARRLDEEKKAAERRLAEELAHRKADFDKQWLFRV